MNEWNEKAVQITGYAKREVLGKVFANFVAKDSKDTVQAVLNDALSGISTSNFEYRLHTKTGDMIDVLLNATPRRGDKDRVCGVISVGQDITERKRGEAELQKAAVDLQALNKVLGEKNYALEAANRMKDEFLANTTHELKTPSAPHTVGAVRLVLEHEGLPCLPRSVTINAMTVDDEQSHRNTFARLLQKRVENIHCNLLIFDRCRVGCFIRFLWRQLHLVGCPEDGDYLPPVLVDHVTRVSEAFRDDLCTAGILSDDSDFRNGRMTLANFRFLDDTLQLQESHVL